jgi:hypothetical protein
MSTESSKDKLDRVVAQAQAERQQREQGYRSRALKMYPWVCGRCAREFNRDNLRELTVHHRDHDHDNNPADGSNWEFAADTEKADATHNPFAELASMLDKKK